MIEGNPARSWSSLAMLAAVGSAVVVQATRMAISAASRPLERFDEGILLSAMSFARHGVVPLRDFYTPYGWGLGLPGALLHALGLDGVFATRILYGSAAVAVVVAAAAVARKSSGSLTVVIVAVCSMSSGTARYAIPTLALLLVTAMSLRPYGASGVTIPALSTSVLVGATSAIRVEYAIFAIVWSAVLTIGVGRSAWRHAILAPVVAFGPYAAIAATGGAPGMIRAWRYAAVGYGEYRRISWDPTAPVTWVRDLDPVAGIITVGYGTALLGAAFLAACALAPRRFLPAHTPRWLASFLAIVLTSLTWSHAVRFNSTQAGELFPLALVGAVVATTRLPRIRVGLLSIAFAGGAGWAIYTTSSVLGSADGERTDVERLRVIPLRPAEAVSLVALRDWWTDADRSSNHVFVANARNDLTAANEAIVYWWLDAQPAAWPTSFDPGLADQPEIQRAVISDLCERGVPPVVRHTGVYSNAELDAGLHFSRRLDEFLAMNYDIADRSPLYDMLERRAPRCVRSEQSSEVSVRRRRDELRAQGDATAAAALSAHLSERAVAAGEAPDPNDVAAARGAGFAVSDDGGR